MTAGTFHNGQDIYRVDILWALAAGLPVKAVRTSTLFPQLCEYPWEKQAPLDFGMLSMGHRRRTIRAELGFPLILDPTGWVADGVHRLLKSFLLDERQVKVVRFPSWRRMEPALIRRQ